MSDLFLRRNAGTHAVITGGTQGLGLAIARRLAEEGAPAICISGRDAAKGEAAAAEVSALGARCVFIRADVSRVGDCQALMAGAIEAFGSVNALVNAAAATSRGTLVDTSVELWEEHFATNVRGPFLLMQGLVRHLLETGRPGSIVNILSMVVHCGQPFLTPYSASKGALANLTKNTANAHRFDRIRCNGLNLGWMDTPAEDQIQRRFHGAADGWLEAAEARQPMGMLIKPPHVASLVAYLLSPESGVMTGAIIDHDQNVPGGNPPV